MTAEYPLNSPLYEPSLYHDAEIHQQLDKSLTRKDVFSTEENKNGISLRVIDIFCNENGTVSAQQHVCATEDRVEKFVLTKADSRIRIVSIHSKGRTQPLQITAKLMGQIMSTYDVVPEFAPIVSSFGQKSEIVDGGSTDLNIKYGRGESRMLSYELRYMEDNHRFPNDPGMCWSHRHTGVYHHYDPDSNFDFFLLLQSTRNSTAELRLSSIVLRDSLDVVELNRICKNPFRIHLLLASSYTLNWRWYLRILAMEFSETNDYALTVEPADPTVTFERVQSLRRILDDVILSRASIKGDLQVVKSLIQLDFEGIKELHHFNFLTKQMEEFNGFTESLIKRIQNSIDMVGYTLDYHNQLESARNNTVVTTITWVSAIYLPGTFAATFYGMNIFSFDENTRSIMITRDAWLFAALFLPLMALTYGLYIAAQRYGRRKQGKRMFFPERKKRRQELESLRAREMKL